MHKILIYISYNINNIKNLSKKMNEKKYIKKNQSIN